MCRPIVHTTLSVTHDIGGAACAGAPRMKLGTLHLRVLAHPTCDRRGVYHSLLPEYWRLRLEHISLLPVPRKPIQPGLRSTSFLMYLVRSPLARTGPHPVKGVANATERPADWGAREPTCFTARLMTMRVTSSGSTIRLFVSVDSTARTIKTSVYNNRARFGRDG